MEGGDIGKGKVSRWGNRSIKRGSTDGKIVQGVGCRRLKTNRKEDFNKDSQQRGVLAKRWQKLGGGTWGEVGVVGGGFWGAPKPPAGLQGGKSRRRISQTRFTTGPVRSGGCARGQRPLPPTQNPKTPKMTPHPPPQKTKGERKHPTTKKQT